MKKLVINDNIFSQQFIVLYDCDTNKKNESIGRVHTFCIPKNTDNRLFLKGIENLLNLPKDFVQSSFYKVSNKYSDYGEKTIIEKLDKMKLCSWICKELTTEQQKSYLKNMEKLLDTLMSMN